MKKIIFPLLLLIPCLLQAQNWQLLGGWQPNTRVTALYTDTSDNSLYISGSFIILNGMDVGGVVKWNGSEFDALNGGEDLVCEGCTVGLSRAITKYKNKIYFNTDAKSYDSIPVKDIASWDGVKWDSVGNWRYQGGYTTNFVEYDSSLFAVGIYDLLDSNTYLTCGILRYNGIDWDPIYFPHPEASYDGPARTATEYNGDLFIGGNFYAGAGTDNEVIGLMRYNNTQGWIPVEHPTGIFYNVQASIVYNGELYISGGFNKDGGNAGNKVMKFSADEHWVEVGDGILGLSGNVLKMLEYHGKLYCFGSFNLEGDGYIYNAQTVRHIAVWDGGRWCIMETFFNGNYIDDAVIYNDQIVICGTFQEIEGSDFHNLAIWTNPDSLDFCGPATATFEPLQPTIKHLQVQPNPVHDILRISIPDAVRTGSLEVYDALGRCVYQRNDVVEALDMSSFASGVYYVLLQSSTGERWRSPVLKE